MIGQHSDQLVFIFRLQQIFDGAFRQSRKSFVGKSKYCKRAFALQHVNQAGGLYRCDQRGKIACRYRGINDILSFGG